MPTQPIVRHLQEYLPHYFPVLLENARAWRTHASGVGGYNPRSRTHAGGLAADIFLDAHDTAQRRIGDALFRMFIDWHAHLGVEYVMWNVSIWSRAQPTVRSQTWHLESPVTRHENHIHVQHLASWGAVRPALLITLLAEVSDRLETGPGETDVIAEILSER